MHNDCLSSLLVKFTHFSVLLITLAISKGYCKRVLDFFPANNFVHKVVKIRMVSLGSLHKVKFLCVFRTLGLEVTNTLGTAKILGSNLTGPVFF